MSHLIKYPYRNERSGGIYDDMAVSIYLEESSTKNMTVGSIRKITSLIANTQMIKETSIDYVAGHMDPFKLLPHYTN